MNETSPTLDEALDFIRAEADRHRAEARAEFRVHAKQVWADLGMRRPSDAQDYAEAVKTLRVAIVPVVAHFKRVMQAVTAALKPLVRELDEAGVLDDLDLQRLGDWS